MRPFRFPEVVTEEDYRANIVRARELLNEAGWHIVDGVLRNAAGEVFEIGFLTRSAGDARTLLPYFQRLKLLGIRGTLVLASGTSEWIHRLREFDFDALLDSMGSQMPPLLGLPAGSIPMRRLCPGPPTGQVQFPSSLLAEECLWKLNLTPFPLLAEECLWKLNLTPFPYSNPADESSARRAGLSCWI